MSNSLTIKRIANDIKEIHRKPIEGIGIISLDNDIKRYIVNIMLLTGPYKHYCLQLLLTFPDDYPINPPKVLIYPGQLFNNLYHRHVFIDESKDEKGICYKKLCIDLLANDFMSTKSQNTGWNPSYTISTLLMQLQIFLSEPDLSENSMPKPYQIKELMESMNNYKRTFIIKEENKEVIKIHTWKDPYPKMFFKKNIEGNNFDSKISDEKNKMIEENLTCFISKSNIFDEPNIILGYPIVKENNYTLYPIPEILSYEGYLTQLSKEEFDVFDYGYRHTLKSANNQYFQAWLPIYINNHYFELNKQTILNSFSVIKFGLSGEENFDFKPEYIYDVMLKMLNKMIDDIIKKKISSSYLIAFFQYILLLKKLSEIYPTKMSENCFYNNMPRLELFSNIKQIMTLSLIDDFNLIEKQLNKIKDNLKHILAVHVFFENKNCSLKCPIKFYEKLKEKNLLNSIFEVIRFEKNFFLYNRKNLRKLMNKTICNSFKEFLLNSDEITKGKLKEIILKDININFYGFVNYEEILDLELNKQIKKDIRDILNNFVILLFIRKKINEKNFLIQLEKNYGVNLEVDKTIIHLNEVINNIDNFYYKETKILNESKYDEIQNIIKELIILIHNSKKEKTIKVGIISNLSHGSVHFLERLTFRNRFFFSYNRIFNEDIRSSEKSSTLLFNMIEKMDLHNLRLLYLYTYERLKKCMSPDNKDLSLIESIFIEYKLNNNQQYEWSNYVLSREKSEYKKQGKLYDKYDMLQQRQIISLFNIAKTINEKLLLDKGQIKYNPKEDKNDYLTNFIFRNIIRLAEILLGEKKFSIYKYIIYPFIKKRAGINHHIYYDEFLIEKLNEIYDKRDITLLTFYEFIWFENYYNICDGFLSSLRNHNLYYFRIRDSINKIKEALNKKTNRKNKKEKFFNKMSYNNRAKTKLNEKFNNINRRK